MRLVKYIFFVGMCGASTVAPYPTCGHNQPWLHALNTPCSTETKKPAWQRFFLAKMVVTPYNKISRYGRQWAFRRASLGGQLDKLDQKIELLRQRGMGHNKSASMIKTIFFDRSPQQLAKEVESLPQGCDPASSCVVSLTSYPARMHAGITLAALVSLVRSQVKPHAIVLYLSKDQFPGEKIGGPYDQAYRVLQDKGVTVRYVDGDLRAHKKYFYVCDDYPHHVHVTVDDDMYYDASMVGTLLRGACQNKNSIVCTTASQIVKCVWCVGSQHCLFQSMPVVKQPSASIFFVCPGGLGTLYPVGFLRRAKTLIVAHNLHRHYSVDDNVIKAVAVMLGVPYYKASGTPGMMTLSSEGMFCDYTQFEKPSIIKLDILNHKIFSHRFPEYDNKNAYEVMNMVPNPDVVKTLAAQNQSAHTGAGAEKDQCAGWRRCALWCGTEQVKCNALGVLTGGQRPYMIRQ